MMDSDENSVHLDSSIDLTTNAEDDVIELVLDQYCSSPKPEIVQALICTRDWLFGDIGNDT